MNRLTTKLKKLTPQDCIKTFQELIGDTIWGMGVLGATSKVPAAKLHGYAGEIFKTK